MKHEQSCRGIKCDVNHRKDLHYRLYQALVGETVPIFRRLTAIILKKNKNGNIQSSYLEANWWENSIYLQNSH